MKWPSWRLSAIVFCVLVLHAVSWLWWQQARSVSGEGTWQVSSPRPLRVKATVLSPTVPSSSKTEARSIPQRSPVDQGLDEKRASHEPAPPLTPPHAGQQRPWAPLPSDYLSVEQVDVFPHPQDDWQLDWSQVPVAQTAWRITVRLWVSAAGRIDHVEVLDAEPHADWINQLLAALPHTPMVPAQLAGQAVPVIYVVQMAPDQLQ